MKRDYLIPDWPAPTRVRAMTTTRTGGISTGPYASFNLGDHVGDDASAVKKNRQQLLSDHRLPNEPYWLRQTHSPVMVPAKSTPDYPEADASFAREPNLMCTVLTADCLPVLICNKAGTEVAAIHAGWKGLQRGILESSLNALASARDDLLVWLGPAMGPDRFFVDDDVRDLFLSNDPELTDCFIPERDGKWRLRIYNVARAQLNRLGVTKISGGELCTHRDDKRFFSYRRDGITGRMASLIWISNGE